MKKILVVEDDPDIAALLSMHLAELDAEVSVSHRGDEGLDAFKAGNFDLVVLDLMLPGMDGLSVCREIRAIEGYVPVLMLTAKSSELDRVLGLEIGADDYLTKPFSIPELQARIKALFRRVEALAQRAPVAAVLEGNGIRLDATQHRVTISGEEVELTAKEFELLSYFMRHPGQVFSRSDLLSNVWGYDHDGYEHTVNTHINRLRLKIEPDISKPSFIQTVWGVGYKFPEISAELSS